MLTVLALVILKKLISLLLYDQYMLQLSVTLVVSFILNAAENVTVKIPVIVLTRRLLFRWFTSGTGWVVFC